MVPNIIRITRSNMSSPLLTWPSMERLFSLSRVFPRKVFDVPREITFLMLRRALEICRWHCSFIAWNYVAPFSTKSNKTNSRHADVLQNKDWRGQLLRVFAFFGDLFPRIKVNWCYNNLPDIFFFKLRQKSNLKCGLRHSISSSVFIVVYNREYFLVRIKPDMNRDFPRCK